MISRKNFFVQGSRLPIEENTKIEFKNHKLISIEEMSGSGFIPRMAPISQTICGFLNQGQGGMVLLGIHDSGQVRGIELTPPQMTHLHYSIQDRIRRFNPPVDPELIQVQFVPVSSSPISSSSEKINCMKKVKDWYFDFRSEADLVDEDEETIDLKCHKFRGNTEKCWCEQEKRRLAQNGIFIQPWIVEIKIGIPKGLKPSFAGEIEGIDDVTATLMYQNEEQVAFLRLDGGNRRMAPFDISRTINEQVRNHYQPIIDKLKAQIDESLSKLKIPSELKKNEIDSKHAGMARDLGHVIQPNLDRACNPSTI